MQYLLTKEELDKAHGTISPEKRKEIVEEVLQKISLEMSVFFTPRNRDSYGHDGDLYRVSLEAIRGAFKRTREEFGIK